MNDTPTAPPAEETPAPSIDSSPPDALPSGDASPFARAEAPPPLDGAASPSTDAQPQPQPQPAKRGRGRPRKPPEGPSIPGAAPPPPLDAPKASAQPQPVNVVRKLFVDPKKAATTISVMLDGALRALAERRYGHDLVEQAKLTAEEQREIVDAFELFMRSADVQLSPGANLALALGGTYATRAVMLEMAHRQRGKSDDGAFEVNA